VQLASRLCVVIREDTVSACRERLQEAAGFADLAELRLDYIKEEIDLPRLFRDKPLPIIATCRPVRQGGRFSGPEDQRLLLLKEAEHLGADYIDIEYDCLDHFKPSGAARIIGSYHNFQEAPAHLETIAGHLAKSRADIVKVAVRLSDITENLRLFRLVKDCPKPMIALGMGEPGYISRILAGWFQGFLTYASIAEGRESAPGQMTARELLDTYAFRQISPSSGLFGVIGNPIRHSRSPYLFNRLFRSEGVDAVYLPLLVSDAPATVRAFRRLDFRGYSVTVPHKKSVIEALDELEPLAKKIGAVNTIARKDGKLIGFNTDAPAAVEAIASGLGGDIRSLSGKRVVLLGAGGAARAIAFALKEAGSRVVIVNRTVEKGKRLAEETGCCFEPTGRIKGVEYDILVNATSVGMTPNVEESPVPREALREGSLVFDVVYTPEETRLIREARSAGARVVKGTEMFLRQAAKQYEIWLDNPAPTDRMKKILAGMD